MLEQTEQRKPCQLVLQSIQIAAGVFHAPSKSTYLISSRSATQNYLQQPQVCCYLLVKDEVNLRRRGEQERCCCWPLKKTDLKLFLTIESIHSQKPPPKVQSNSLAHLPGDKYNGARPQLCNPYSPSALVSCPLFAAILTHLLTLIFHSLVSAESLTQNKSDLSSTPSAKITKAFCINTQNAC